MSVIRHWSEAELHQKISDALEDAGLFNPSCGLIDDVYAGAVEPLAEQLRGAVEVLAVLVAQADKYGAVYRASHALDDARAIVQAHHAGGQ